MNKEGYIPTLDGLRAVAILIVIASHSVHTSSEGAVSAAIDGLGHMGVMIFFALSGYLITTRLLDEYRLRGRISLRDFYLRRAFRILPPALTYLGVVSALSLGGVIICSGAAIRAALLFYANYIDGGDTSWRVIHFWSLSVEEHFYLLWPALLIGFGVWRGWRTAITLAAAVILWRAIDHHYQLLFRIFHDPQLKWNFSGTDVIADALLWGCYLAFFKLKLPGRLSTAIAIFSATILALYTMKIRIPATPHNVELILTATHMLPAVLLGSILACPRAPIGRFLELAPMRFIGKLSYSLYIWQQLFLGGPGLPLPLALCAAFVCAYLSYRFIEQPSIRFGREFIQAKQLAIA